MRKEFTLFSQLMNRAKRYLSDIARRSSAVNVDSDQKTKRLVQFAGEALILGLAIVPPLIGWIGWDFVYSYRGEVLRGVFGELLWAPWPIVWLLYPFAILPIQWGALLWGIVQAIGYIYALRRLGGQPLWFALSLPCIWTFLEGQNEGFITWGLVLAVTAHPIIAGLGLVLLSFKPQFSLLVAAFILYQRRDWRMLVVPTIVYGLSLLVWGFWIDDWINAVKSPDAGHLQTAINAGMFPYSLILLPVLFVFKDIRIWAIIQTLSGHYASFYVFAPAMVMRWQSRWSMPVLVIGSWVISLLKPVQIPFLPGLYPMSIVLLASLITEGSAYLHKRRTAVDSPEDFMLHSEQSSTHSHGED